MLADTIKIAIAIALVLLATVGKVFLFSEWLEKHPNIKKIAESRTTYIVLLVVAIGLLAGVFQEINAVREALNVPPPTPRAPLVPQIVVQPLSANVSVRPLSIAGIRSNAGKVEGNTVNISGTGPVATAPNGIAIGGGTVANPTVNNFGPPPAHLSHTEEMVTSSSPNDSGLKVMKVHISTDRPIPGAMVVIRFSGPIEPIMPGQDEPQMKGTTVFQVNWGSLASNNIPIPNSLGIAISIPAAFLPNEELIVTVKSKTEVTVLEVGPTH